MFMASNNHLIELDAPLWGKMRHVKMLHLNYKGLFVLTWIKFAFYSVLLIVGWMMSTFHFIYNIHTEMHNKVNSVQREKNITKATRKKKHQNEDVQLALLEELRFIPYKHSHMSH